MGELPVPNLLPGEPSAQVNVRLDSPIRVEARESFPARWGMLIISALGIAATFGASWSATRSASHDKQFEVTFVEKRRTFVALCSQVSDLYDMTANPSDLPNMTDPSTAEAAHKEWFSQLLAKEIKFNEACFSLYPFLPAKADRDDFSGRVHMLSALAGSIADVKRREFASQRVTPEQFAADDRVISAANEAFLREENALIDFLLVRLFPRN